MLPAELLKVVIAGVNSSMSVVLVKFVYLRQF
jgi:hypothetical protein